MIPGLSGLSRSLSAVNVDDTTIAAVTQALEESAQGYTQAELPDVAVAVLGGSASGAEFGRNVALATMVLNEDFGRSRGGLRDGGTSLRQYREEMKRADEQAEADFVSAMGRLGSGARADLREETDQ